MPTYEYHCSKCNKSFEVVQPMSAQPLETCPKDLCALKKWGKGKVKRGVGGGSGLIFKGSGFYITDYRSEGYKSAAKSDTGSSSSSSSSSSTKPSASSDSKPSTPAPAAPAKSSTKSPTKS